MTSKEYKCFVIMPFKPELHYFYLYLEKYLKDRYQITCERADTKVRPDTLLYKINNFIKKSDFIISEITKGNANVMYETGAAHYLKKKVILITQDENKDIPSDLKGKEYIHYELDKHEDFFAKLDNIVSSIIFDKDYIKLFKEAKKIFDDFIKDTEVNAQIVSKEEFVTRMRNKELTESFVKGTTNLTQYLLPLIIKENLNMKVIKAVSKWALKAKT